MTPLEITAFLSTYELPAGYEFEDLLNNGRLVYALDFNGRLESQVSILHESGHFHTFFVDLDWDAAGLADAVRQVLSLSMASHRK